MITIRELINRIRWDPEYGRGEFDIGYFDRLEERVIVVPLGEVWFKRIRSSLPWRACLPRQWKLPRWWRLTG